jgi:hypothetical protein
MKPLMSRQIRGNAPGERGRGSECVDEGVDLRRGSADGERSTAIDRRCGGVITGDVDAGRPGLSAGGWRGFVSYDASNAAARGGLGSCPYGTRASDPVRDAEWRTSPPRRHASKSARFACSYADAAAGELHTRVASFSPSRRSSDRCWWRCFSSAADGATEA